MPTYSPGLRVGLLGGSFNPAHDAHLAISLFAMKRLRLDRVWWLVTPGNPLKDATDLPPLAKRLAAARRVARHPRIAVSGLEAVIHTRYTVDTIRWLKRRCPGMRFVWIMGADNLKDFHRWHRWRCLAALVPIAIVDRGGREPGGGAGRAFSALMQFRLPERAASTLIRRKPPAWIFLHGRKSPLSSTALRAKA